MDGDRSFRGRVTRIYAFESQGDAHVSEAMVRHAARLAAVAAAAAGFAALPARASDVLLAPEPSARDFARDDPSREAAYIDAMVRQLDKGKRYPTGREASLTHPSGVASVWVVVSRDGRVAGRGIDRSSGSPLLDQTATSLVGRKRYAAFPRGSWDDAPTHRFVVGYRFDPEGVSADAGAQRRVAQR